MLICTAHCSECTMSLLLKASHTSVSVADAWSQICYLASRNLLFGIPKSVIWHPEICLAPWIPLSSEANKLVVSVHPISRQLLLVGCILSRGLLQLHLVVLSEEVHTMILCTVLFCVRSCSVYAPVHECLNMIGCEV